jgi:hypothetical protein
MQSNIAAVHIQDQVLTPGPAGELVSYHVEQKRWALGLQL